MFSKLFSVIKIFFYKIIYFKKLYISWKSLLYKNSKIYIDHGKVNIKEHLNLKENSRICVVNGGNVTIGKKVAINYNTIIAAHKNITIGNYVSIGPNCCFYDHDHKFNKNGLQNGFNKSDIIIEDNVWIGAGCIILRGTHIGKNSVIAAGCIVKGNIPNNTLVTNNRELNIKDLHD